MEIANFGFLFDSDSAVRVSGSISSKLHRRFAFTSAIAWGILAFVFLQAGNFGQLDVRASEVYDRPASIALNVLRAFLMRIRSFC
jgi:hypothetical protein